jgi:hypothetical protein
MPTAGGVLVGWQLNFVPLISRGSDYFAARHGDLHRKRLKLAYRPAIFMDRTPHPRSSLFLTHLMRLITAWNKTRLDIFGQTPPAPAGAARANRAPYKGLA